MEMMLQASIKYNEEIEGKYYENVCLMRLLMKDL
jgi:hypothetical protein